MKTSDFMYDLPEELIAQTPVEPRDHSRLMVVDKTHAAQLEHKHFYDVDRTISTPAMSLIINETRVIPARLIGERAGGGACEIAAAQAAWPQEVGNAGAPRQAAASPARNGDLRRRQAEGASSLGTTRTRAAASSNFELRGHARGGAGRAGRDAPAPLHPRKAGGPRPLPDRLRHARTAPPPPPPPACTSRRSCWSASARWAIKIVPGAAARRVWAPSGP